MLQGFALENLFRTGLNLWRWLVAPRDSTFPFTSHSVPGAGHRTSRNREIILPTFWEMVFFFLIMYSFCFLPWLPIHKLRFLMLSSLIRNKRCYWKDRAVLLKQVFLRGPNSDFFFVFTPWYYRFDTCYAFDLLYSNRNLFMRRLTTLFAFRVRN